jgi:hypothetical protein
MAMRCAPFVGPCRTLLHSFSGLKTRSKRCERRKHGIRMTARGNVFEDVPDDTGLVDDEGRSTRYSAAGALNAQTFQDSAFRVREQMTPQIEFRGKTLVRLDRVFRYPDEHRVRLIEVSRPLTEFLRFDRSAGCIVHWVRPENDVLRTSKFSEIDVARLRLSLNRRKFIAHAHGSAAHGCTGRT